jgi:endonuclease/exonuclease/phosphatase family metal-dependent hydrolase
MKNMKKILLFVKILAALLIGIAAAFVVLIGYLSLNEYRPEAVESLRVEPGEGPPLAPGEPLRLISMNIGYASLDATQDFFMDGGKGVRPATDKNVHANLEGIKEFLNRTPWDIALFQEVDINSHRSYYVDQAAYLSAGRQGSSVFAYNFLCPFVPIPLFQWIGRVEGGLLTLSAYQPREALRIALPTPFAWPIRVAQLKRCLLVERIPIQGGDKDLILVNLHLEAYDDGAGKEAQTRVLMDFLQREYEGGNYCIAGGDFNQTFPDIDENRFPVRNREFFVPGKLSPAMLPLGWRFAADPASPSARLLNEPYSGIPEETQLYLIDGFILSPNVELVSVETIDMDFRYSDHNPVGLEVILRE